MYDCCMINVVGDRLGTVRVIRYNSVTLTGNRRDNINTIMPECGLVTSWISIRYSVIRYNNVFG